MSIQRDNQTKFVGPDQPFTAWPYPPQASLMYAALTALLHRVACLVNTAVIAAVVLVGHGHINSKTVTVLMVAGGTHLFGAPMGFSIIGPLLVAVYVDVVAEAVNGSHASPVGAAAA